MNKLQLLYTWLMTRRDEAGATAVEYGLLVALIAAVIIGTVLILGTEVNEAFQDVVDVMPNP
jgi:pilus assembly protein Flp/PilA